jgi:hypothetical protein
MARVAGSANEEARAKMIAEEGGAALGVLTRAGG